MKMILLVLALQVVVVSSKSSNHEWKKKIIAENQQQVAASLASSGLSCQSLVAYVVGTFQSKDSQTPSFSAEFQVRLDADLKKKRITINADQWNEDYSNSSDFYLDFYYENSQQWCDIREEDCSASFARNVTNFKLDLNKQDGSSFFHLLYFDYFNNSFALTKANGQCTKHQLDGINDEWTPNLDELSICVCCDEYSPNKLLFCPEDPWKGITSAPGGESTPSPPTDITCSSFVAYYNGNFSNSNNDWIMEVEFETRMWLSDTEGKLYYQIDEWNQSKTKGSDARFILHDNAGWHSCDLTTGDPCWVERSSKNSIFLVLQHYNNGIYENEYYFSYFPSLQDQFTLINAVGNCTKYQKTFPDGHMVDPKYFEFCACCGDKYDPHPSLNCPKNPWA